MTGLILFFLPCFLCFLSICVTFVVLHKILKHKEPFSYSSVYAYLGITNKTLKANSPRLIINPETIKQLANDIDKYFISKWFTAVSKDNFFSKESVAFLEEALTRIANVQLQVNNKQLIHGILNIILKHLKEYKRSLRRKEKYDVAIENLYRYSHTCSISNNKKCIDYFLHQLTINLLKHFINSELWNSLPSHVLVAIVAKSFINYLFRLSSNPEILNYLLLMCISSEATKEKLQLSNYARISLVDRCESNGESNEKKETLLKAVQTKDAVTQNGKTVMEISLLEKCIDAKPVVDSQILATTKEIKPEEENQVVLRRRVAPQLKKPSYSQNVSKSPQKKSDPVKIYESKSASKTWRDSRDLACISLGQDPLDCLQNIEDVKAEEIKSDTPTSSGNIFNDVINIKSMEGLKTSIKPISEATERTFHNIKDLQETTVNSALHKIGDLQVIENDNNKKIEKLNYSIHTLPPNTLLHSSVLSNTQYLLQVYSEDEAAGMVEGILDFGRAGFRKGLKLTGLTEENIENAKSTFSNVAAATTRTKAMREQVRKKLEEFRQSDSDSGEKLSISDSVEMVQIDSPSVSDQTGVKPKIDSPKKLSHQSEELSIPPIYTEEPSESGSPDPEYEDTADLASSIAKLRSLLQQRSSESGFSTPAVSPMPDEYIQKQQEIENVSDTEAMEVDGMMPTFYKFCTKTASDVLSNTLNTIKTALPGNNSGYFPVLKWKFKAAFKESEMLTKMKKILTERKEYCILDKEIDTGYDVLDTVDIFQQSPVRISNLQFEDELDDFEAKVPITKVCLDIMCELLADTNSFLIQEPVIKGILLTCGALIEQNIDMKIDEALDYLTKNLIEIPENANTNTLSMTFDEFIEELFNGFPGIMKLIIQNENLRGALKLFVSSIQKQNINQDVVLQIFEFVTMKLIQQSVTPPVSA